MDTEKPGLDLENLKAIVKLCVKNGVRSLKWRDLVLEFGEQAENSSGEINSPPLASRKSKPVKEITEEQHKENTALALEKDELSLREQQFADLQLENPLLAEEMILNGELDDDSGDDDTADE